MENLEKELIKANERFTYALKCKYKGDLAEMICQEDIEDYLPLINITIHLTRIEKNPEKIKEFVDRLESLVDRSLYYEIVVEDIAYRISPELSDFINSLLQ